MSRGSIRKCLKRMTRVEDDGCALTDEVLLVFASSSLDTDDLLHCAATCRRWRRLVTSEAELICRREPPSDRLVSALAVGFFHQRRDNNSSASPLQFFPSPSSRGASLDGVFGGDLLRNSRLIASRNGRLLLELRRDAALRLVVYNAITGGVFLLPSFHGKHRPEHYACALLTLADLGDAVHPLLRPESAGFRIVLLYTRAYSMVCRSFSSDTNAWGPEGEVSGANISSRKLGEMDAGVGVGGTVFWLSSKVVFGLRLDTLQGTVESPRGYGMHRFGSGHPYPDCRLVVLPEGRLGAVQVGRGDAGKFVMNLFSRNGGKRDRWVKQWVWDAQDVDLKSLLPSPVSGAVKSMRLRAVCERSGLIFFAAMHGKKQNRALYALDLEKKEVQLMPFRPGGCCFRRPPSCSFHGCDMDLVAYLTSLVHGELRSSHVKR